MVIKTATDVALEDFQDKLFLKKCTMFQTPSNFEMKKVGPLVEKIFFQGSYNRISRFRRNI